ncbi:LysR substrate-binding domain-containing protein [Bacillus sp. FJAT-18017]|uniref:LysR substrate-binding domain-containing protein n=1 Tax=Bacillus sp. FJAT-18017 TaxID=1705566 RepID=UPI001E3EF429|nr:LysR substrate-binding domain-containing protein [Bacillus sp. FJAT-18017]
MNKFTLQELKVEPFLCFSEGCGYRTRLEAWYKDQNITPQKVMEFGTFETILRVSPWDSAFHPFQSQPSPIWNKADLYNAIHFPINTVRLKLFLS